MMSYRRKDLEDIYIIRTDDTHRHTYTQTLQLRVTDAPKTPSQNKYQHYPILLSFLAQAAQLSFVSRCDLAYFLREDKFVDLGCPNGVLACAMVL